MISELHQLAEFEERKNDHSEIQQLLEQRKRKKQRFDSNLNPKKEDDEDIYGMCDAMLEEIKEIDATLNNAPASGYKSRLEEEEDDSP